MTPIYIIYSIQYRLSLYDRYVRNDKIVGIYENLLETIYAFKKYCYNRNNNYYNNCIAYILDIKLNSYCNYINYTKVITNNYILYMTYHQNIRNTNIKYFINNIDKCKKTLGFNYRNIVESDNNNTSVNNILNNFEFNNEYSTYYVVNSYIKLINNKHIEETDDKYSRYLIFGICDNLEKANEIYNKTKFELAKNIPEGIMKYFNYYLRIDIISGGNFTDISYNRERFQEKCINIKTEAVNELKLEIYKIFQQIENNEILNYNIIGIILEFF